jgi:hypothetical protein
MKSIQCHTSRFILLIFAMLLLASSACSSASAKRTVGVQVGDWAEYTVTGTFQGNASDPFVNATDPFENVTSVRMTVINIVDTNVTLEAHVYYENGSDAVDPGWVDVDTGNGTYSGWIIAANLNAGDHVYTDNQTMFGELTMNETIMREYVGSMVEVNHCILNVTTPPNPFYNMSMLLDWYWYRDSGMVVEMHMYIHMEGMGDAMLVDVHMNLTDVIPEFPIATYVPAFMLTTIAVVAVLAKFRKAALAGP